MGDSTEATENSENATGVHESGLSGLKRCADNDPGEEPTSKKTRAEEQRETIPAPTIADDQPGNACRLLALAEELLDEIVREVEVEALQTLTWVSRNLRRIAMPHLWKNTHIDFTRPQGHSFSREGSGAMEVGLEVGLFFGTKYNTAIVRNITDYTRNLTLTVPGDTQDDNPHILPFFTQLVQCIKNAPLEQLLFRRSRLDWVRWVELGDALSDRAGFIRTIKEISFPSVTTADAHAEHEARETELYESGKTWAPQMFPCSAQLAFQCHGIGHERMVILSAVGSVQRSFSVSAHPLDLQPAQGTSASEFEEVMTTMGPPTQFHSIALEHEYYYKCQGVFSMILAAPITQQIRVTRLTLTRIWLTEAETNQVRRIDVSAMEHLHLEYCGNMEIILDAFKDGEPSQLKTFNCIRPIFHTVEQSRPHVVETFLRRISGLRVLRFISNDEWMMDLGLALRNHSSLEELALRFGAQDLTPPRVQQIREACPNLKHFSFQPAKMDIPLRIGRTNLEFRKSFYFYAIQLVRFPCLRELVFIMCPVKNMLAGNLKIIADSTHKILLDAHGENGNLADCRIKKIKTEVKKAFTPKDDGMPFFGRTTRAPKWVRDSERIVAFEY
ncbi:uncharacterized protein EI97DRAFT_100652 [Westerdykella ornata]|uniref:F-box domain-containing protein n=1 Tax=Westerdykella ornata TaxID=318751 RepID=A0A6A6JD47_WESOR|nr:uncharacterized protein EI97DRAFT_100652 [Westerdykella ornata]KAF2274481.1 hypothetical protein EI97DRAFT_100652 [Westerdykella ornata]